MIKALQVLRIHLLELEKVCISAPIKHFLNTDVYLYVFMYIKCILSVAFPTQKWITCNTLSQYTYTNHGHFWAKKVQELCRDFCTRYIACLRGKMQSENLLRSDYPLEHNNNLSNSNSPVNTPDHVSK